VFKWLILLSILFAAAASADSVWTWTDENGVVHYSDRPVPGAREIELRGAQTIPIPQAETRTEAPGLARSDVQPYRTVQVISPSAEETLWNIGGNLTVQIATDPGLRGEHRVDVSLNGQRMNLESASTRVTVPEVWRGEHVLRALILDSEGRELQRSEPIVFYVQQTSIQNPNNPSGRRP
jgi:hypothetical protein